jgi:hypothetical protein
LDDRTVGDKQTQQIYYLRNQIFWQKSDDRSETGQAKGAQKWCFHVIPTLFGRAKFLNKFFGLYYIYIWLNVGT